MRSTDTFCEKEGRLYEKVYRLLTIELGQNQEKYHLPRIYELYDQLQGATHFPKIDLRHG